MSEKDIEFEFKNAKGAVIRIKAPKEVVDDYLSKYSVPVEEAFSQQAATAETTQETSQNPLGDLPDKPETKSISEYVQAVVNSPWGKKGRTSTEIMKLANTHGIMITMSSLSGILFGLTQKNEITRIRGEKEQVWRYYPKREYSLRQANE